MAWGHRRYGHDRHDYQDHQSIVRGFEMQFQRQLRRMARTDQQLHMHLSFVLMPQPCQCRAATYNA